MKHDLGSISYVWGGTCKSGRNEIITNPDWIFNLLKTTNKNKGNKMDEEQEKYIVDELKSKIKILENRKRNLTLQMASAGRNLWEVMGEIDKANGTLDAFRGNNEENS
jgi:hypothetical protein